MKLIALLVIALALALPCVQARLEFRDGTFYDGDVPNIIKAVGYSPVPIGADPTLFPPYGDYFTADFASIYNRDLNILRLWGWGIGNNHTDFLNVAYNNGVNPIYVAVEFWMGPGTYPNLADPGVQAQVLADFTTFMTAIKNHPGVLCYIIGSDLNAQWNYGTNLAALFSMIDKLADYAHKLNSLNLITTALNDADSLATISTFDSISVDFWSINVYRGCTFGVLFNQFSTATKKSLFISEYGIDSYNDKALALDMTLQSNCIVSLSKEILVHNATTIGGAVVEYVDEYWKGKLGQTDARHPGCPNYNAQLHTNCGYTNEAFPDEYANQAWFGIVNSSYVPRTVFYALQSLWASV